MLIGSYLGSLSEKRRVAVPKKFLDDLGEKPIVAKWYEDCLILVGKEFWNKLFFRLTGGKKTISYGVREIERFIFPIPKPRIKAINPIPRARMAKCR